MKKILVVDDDTGMRTLLAEILTAEGHQVTTQCDGKEAFHTLKKDHDWDVILVDYQMPFMNGEELLRSLISLNARPKRAILISGYLHQGPDISELLEALPSLYILEKPFSVDSLLKLIR